MMYEIVKTNDGIEVRDSEGDVIAGPSSTDPIRGDALSDLLSDAGFSDRKKQAIRIALGDVDYDDKRDNS